MKQFLPRIGLISGMAAAEILPLTSYLLPLTSYLLPLSSFLLPLSSFLFPLSSYLLPLTSYLFPLSSFPCQRQLAQSSGHKKSPLQALACSGHINWRRPTLTGPIAQLPSALKCFTSGFGTGPGGSTLLWSPDFRGKSAEVLRVRLLCFTP